MQRLMSVKEAAEYLGVSGHMLYQMVSQRRIPYMKVGRLVKFDQAMLDGCLKQNAVMPMPAKTGI